MTIFFHDNLFSIYISGIFVKNQTSVVIVRQYLGSLFHFIGPCICFCPVCVLTLAAVILLFRFSLVILVFLCFHIKFKIVLSMSMKNRPGI